MLISQWNLTGVNSPISGLHRYDNEIFKECSKHLPVIRCRSHDNKFKTLNGFKQGDVTHITTQQLGFLKTLKYVKNCAVTIHDLIQCTWYTQKQKFKEHWYLNDLFLKNCNMFICDSEYTRLDLLEKYKVNEDNTKTVYLGVDHDIFRPLNRETCRDLLHMNQDETYLLSVSSGVPWKNTGILKELPYNILDIGYGRGVFGTITDNNLALLYNACDAFLAPSKHEGFGLPVLESMACGCPVVASDCTSLPEVVGDGGLLVNPDDSKEWIEAIEIVLSSSDKQSKRAIEQASKFSWSKCGSETCQIYESMF